MKTTPTPADTPVLKCLVTDDEQIAVRGIVNYIGKLDFLTVSATCSSAIEASEILRSQEIDLMFLDINMPLVSGLQFLETLENPPMTIFTTAYSEYALEGYRLNVVDYLLKPIPFQRFFQAASKAQEIYKSRIIFQENNSERDTGVYIRQDDTFQRIVWEDIMYIESMQNYLKLHLKSKTIVIHQTMVSLEEMLPEGLFFRIHRSFIVNLSYIESITGTRLFIGSKELPIAQARKEELLNDVVYKKLLSK